MKKTSVQTGYSHSIANKHSALTLCVKNMDIIHGKDTLLPRVMSVEPHEDYTMTLTFTNGERKPYNAEHLLNLPVYKNLRIVFMTAKAEYGTVTWPGNMDISHETLYECGTQCK